MIFINPFDTDINPFLKNLHSFDLSVYQRYLEDYKAHLPFNKPDFNSKVDSILEGFEAVGKNDYNNFTIRGGEFPSSVFSMPKVIKALHKVSSKAIQEKRFGVFGGAYICIGEFKLDEEGEAVKDNEGNKIFVPSEFLRSILELKISYRVKKVLSYKETYYNPELKIVHHPFNEHHFRFLEEKDNDTKEIELKSTSHIHNPKDGERMWSELKYEDKRYEFSNSLTQKEVLDTYKKKRLEVLINEDPDYSSFKDVILEYNNNDKFKSTENRFIVDLGDTTYQLATKDHINKFVESVSGILEKSD